jgi:hypothetical protein
VKGIQHGMGKMMFPDGKEKEGFFENNIYKGRNPPEQLIEELGRVAVNKSTLLQQKKKMNLT